MHFLFLPYTGQYWYPLAIPKFETFTAFPDRILSNKLITGNTDGLTAPHGIRPFRVDSAAGAESLMLVQEPEMWIEFAEKSRSV